MVAHAWVKTVKMVQGHGFIGYGNSKSLHESGFCSYDYKKKLEKFTLPRNQ